MSGNSPAQAGASPNGTAAARFIAATAQRAYAPEVVEEAKKCLVDWLGCGLGATGDPVAVSVRKAALAWGGKGRAPLLLGGTTTPALAALANGTAAHAMDYDDTHPYANVHVSGATWAATLAMAAHHGTGAREALAAFITGFETAARIGDNNGRLFGRQLQFRGFHPTSVLVRFAAAASSAVILGLDEARAAHALGIAATAAAGLNASFGTMSKPFHAGKAAMDGILAAQLAAEGFEAATHLLDAPNGLAPTLVQALAQEGAATLGPLEFSEGWELTRNAYKPYACCKGTHATLDAARTLAAEVRGQKIEGVRLGVHPQAKLVAGKPDPQTPLEAKFSLAFCAAIGLLGYRAVFTDFTEARLKDPAVREIVRRVEVETPADIEHTASWMEVRLAGGRTLRAETKIALGNAENPMTWDDLEGKFLGLAEPVLGARARTLLQALRHVEEPGRFAEVLALIGGPAR